MKEWEMKIIGCRFFCWGCMLMISLPLPCEIEEDCRFLTAFSMLGVRGESRVDDIYTPEIREVPERLTNGPHPKIRQPRHTLADLKRAYQRFHACDEKKNDHITLFSHYFALPS